MICLEEQITKNQEANVKQVKATLYMMMCTAYIVCDLTMSCFAPLRGTADVTQ